MTELLQHPSKMTDRELIAAIVDIEDALTHTQGVDEEGFYFWSAVAQQLFDEMAARA